MESLLKKLPDDTIIQKFKDPDPFHEQTYPSPIAAKSAISKLIGKPLSKLSSDQMAIINQQIAKSLDKKQIKKMIDHYLIKKPNLRIVGGENGE